MSPVSAVTPSVPGLLAGRVDVVGERDPVRVARQQRRSVRRERGPEAGDDVVEAGLVGHQRVGVALDDDGLTRLADRTLGAVDQVERPALVEQRRRRGVEVLGPLPLEEPTAEADGVAVLVADREEDAGTELVDDAAAALARAGETDLDELLGADVALGLRAGATSGPSRPAPTELMSVDGRVGEAATLEIVEGRLAGFRAGQNGVVEDDRGSSSGAVEPAEHPHAWSARGFDASLLGQGPKHLGERRAHRAP